MSVVAKELSWRLCLYLLKSDNSLWVSLMRNPTGVELALWRLSCTTYKIYRCDATPLKLHITTDVLLSPGYGTWGNILMPALTRISQGQKVAWTWSWKIKAPHMRWVALLAHGFCIMRSTCVMTNMIVDWAHTYATVENGSACWVCTEVPVGASLGLAWHIQPPAGTNWTQKQSTFWSYQKMADWNETKRLIIQDVKKQQRIPHPQGEHGLWERLSCLHGLNYGDSHSSE